MAHGGAMAKRKKPGEAPGLKEQLRTAIKNSGRSLHQLGSTCGIGADRLSRFLNKKRSLSLEAAERICAALGLKLVPEGPPKKTAPMEEE
jgi:transcriptional regulator with XRE-family HTH domain